MRNVPGGMMVWALDPFEENVSLARGVANFLGEWQRATRCRIQPVYVLSGRQFGLGLELEFDSPRSIEGEAKKRMSELVERLGVRGTLVPEVILCRTMSRAKEADALSEFALKHGAEAVVMSAHARGGLKRLFVGSFTEATLLRSRVPVVTLNPGVKRGSGFKRILFPTEFGPYAARVYHRVVELARNLGAQITLMHVGPSFRASELMVGALGYPIPPPVLDQELELRKRRVERHFEQWTRYGAKMGVSVDSVTLPSGGSIAAKIVSIAKRKSVGLIALESESGWVRSALLGSVTREVVRHSSCSVWVISPKEAMKARARKRQQGRLQAA